VSREPLVSIGLSVYNGERYLREALTSLLAQDHAVFEVMISDSGSRDGTEEICREYERRDSRIRYVRHSENRGAAWNSAFVAREARGEYFMWAAHDDLWDPSFIRKCLAMLEAHPEAVLCCTEDTVIDAVGDRIPNWVNYKNIGTLGMTPVERIHALISRVGWFALYGLIRREAVLKISLGLDVLWAEATLLLELLLLGDFVIVDEHLFSTRIVGAGKTLEGYQRHCKVEAPVGETNFTSFATRLIETVYRSGLSSGEKAEVFADFILTLACSNPYWRRMITAEFFGPHATLTDSQFALLLGMVLNRCVPLSEARHNPLSQAIYNSPVVAPDLLPMARRILRDAGADDAYRRTALLFEQGHLEEASDGFRKILVQQESSKAWSDWATVQLACKRISDAEQGLRRALAFDTQNQQAVRKLGILLASVEKYQEAIPYLEHSVAALSGEKRTAVLELLNQCRAKAAAADAT
jgi:hypothetical protein